MVVASITSVVADHGIYAVFALMAIASVLPVGSELVMVFAGSLAATADHLGVFGSTITSPAWIYVAVCLAGIAGATAGALAGWAIGYYGGRPLLERHGRWLHVTPERLNRAESRLERYEAPAVVIGVATPGLRSFVAIPAGIVRMPVGRFVPAAAAGAAIFCFALAAGGWALGANYDRLHRGLEVAAVVLVVAVVAVVAVAIWRARRSSRLSRRASDPAG